MQNNKCIGTPGVNDPNFVFMTDREDYFVCDKCGRQYSFTQSWLSVKKGDVYCSPLTNNQQEVASMDLCRDCSGMTAKLEQNGIDEAIINAGVAMEEKGIQTCKKEARSSCIPLPTKYHPV